jgi:hypothetical protein
MFDRADVPAATLRALPAETLPVEEMLIGMPAVEAAALLPRIFNLCRGAQSTAACLAFGLPDPGADIAAEIRRDHVLKLFVQLPGHFGGPATLPATPFDPVALRNGLFGPTGKAPCSGADMTTFLGSGHGLAPLLRRVTESFAGGVATTGPLPLVTPENGLTAAPVENSPAARRADHPGLRSIAAREGRSMLWRVMGRMIDLDAVLDGDLPPPRCPRIGLAQVQATRGLYTIRAHQTAGRVTRFVRVTPTDHLLAPGGVLARCLATLPADCAGLAPMMLDILDPCSPVRLEEVGHA